MWMTPLLSAAGLLPFPWQPYNLPCDGVPSDGDQLAGKEILHSARTPVDLLMIGWWEQVSA
jgi:hypothetical protein